MGWLDFIGDVVSFIPNTISAIGNTVVGNKNVEAQKDANEQNVAMQKETNAQNYQMFHESQDFSREMYQRALADQWDMWNAQNAYNSASSQRRRLEAAGLNPYMMMSGGNAGTASSMSSPSASSPSYSPAQAPRVNPVIRQFMGGFQLSNLAESFLRIQEQKADIQAKGIDNQYRSTKNALDLAERLAKIRGMKEDTKGKAIQNLFDGASFNSRLALAIQQPEALNLQIQGMSLNNQLQQKNLGYVDQEKLAMINKTIAETAKVVAERKRLQKLTRAEFDNIVSRTFLQNKQNWNLPIRNKADADRYAEAYLQSQEAAGIISGYEAGKAAFKSRDYWWGSPQDVDASTDILLPWKGWFK